ncbi:Uncharacterised protein [Amycolatopsis camponoti]|uniref:Uncharacterized protein n=1 Tax=Amycolatopsis camponoti TaxID=2606593 RepID=A0A6I8M208_9PSEU|nr:hypothetical protein [Amycolatopsis camponoti]VVJ22702.1 Uncharacterised protein [Amycolatopsis camponoti]
MTSTTVNALAERAVTVARRYREAAPREFAERHAVPSRWSRRTSSVANLASALGIPADTILVRDDPQRRYGIDASLTPGDLYEIASDSGHRWQFIPDLTGFTPSWGWLLLGACPHCEAPSVPVARVAGLADLGAHLDPESEHHGTDTAPLEFDGDPGHHSHCPYATRA